MRGRRTQTWRPFVIGSRVLQDRGRLARNAPQARNRFSKSSRFALIAGETPAIPRL